MADSPVVFFGLTRRQYLDSDLLSPALLTGFGALSAYSGYIVLRRSPLYTEWWAQPALWILIVTCVWRTLNIYDDMSDPAIRRAGGQQMILTGVLLLSAILASGWRVWQAGPWPEANAVVVASDVREGRQRLAFAYEVRGRQYVSAPFPAAGPGGLFGLGTKHAIYVDPDDPREIETGLPGRRTERLGYLGIAVAIFFLSSGWRLQ